MMIAFLAAVAFAISSIFTHRFCNPDSVFYILDHPTDRSLHDRPVPRGGGLAILIAILICGTAASLLVPARDLTYIALATLIVASVSFFDDRYSVSPLYRLTAHGFAAVIILYGGFSLQRLEFAGGSWDWPYAVGAVFTVLFTVWMINLYNFMDGMDGFAGGMAVFGFGTFATMGWMAGHDAFYVTSLIVASASAGFLVLNVSPARIFMGDIGSSTLGLMAAMFSLWGARDNVFPFWVAVLVFSPFIMDATVTLFLRLWRGEKIWQAHKTHFYQRLVQAGLGHRKTVSLEYVIMLGCGVSALWSVHAPEPVQIGIIAVWALIYFFFFLWVARFAASSQPGSPRR